MPLPARSALRRLAASTFLLSMLLAGCSSGGSSSGGGTTSNPYALASGGASTVYTLQNPGNTGNTVLAFSASSSGSVSPTVTLPISTSADSIATDTSGNIYIGGYNSSSALGQVAVYAPGATAASTPVRTFTLPSGYFFPSTMTADSTGRVYMVATSTSGTYAILVFAAGATGATTPTVINPGIFGTPLGIAVDTAGSIYVTNNTSSASGSILVFASSASGSSATPARTISYSGFAVGIAVDSSLNTWVGLTTATTSGTTINYSASIAEYAAGASGNATPTKTISGSATNLSSSLIAGMRFDAAGNLWLVRGSSLTSSPSTGYIDAWPASATGNQAPAVQFTSTAWSTPGVEFAVK